MSSDTEGNMSYGKYIFAAAAGIVGIGAIAYGLCAGCCSEKTALNVREKAIVRIASQTASGCLKKLEKSMHYGLDNGLSVNEIKEILIQQYAYAGFPRALNGVSTFIKVTQARKDAGIADKAGDEGTPLAQNVDKNAFGSKVQEELIGAKATGAYQAFTPALDAFLKEHLFADIFGRGVLSRQDREIATVAALSSVKGVEPQLRSHVKIALHIGVSPAKIVGIMDMTKSCKGRKILKQVLKERAAAQPSDAKISVARAGDMKSYDGAAANFTGKVKVFPLGDKDALPSVSKGLVRFEAGARTVWHTHPVGQMIIIVDGVGRVQQEGGEIVKVYAGDAVWFPAGVKHWHGADENQAMSHYALTGVQDGEAVTWMEPVKD